MYEVSDRNRHRPNRHSPPPLVDCYPSIVHIWQGYLYRVILAARKTLLHQFSNSALTLARESRRSPNSHSSMMLSTLDFSLARKSKTPRTTKKPFTSLGQPRSGTRAPHLVAERMYARGFGRPGDRLLSEPDKKGKIRPKERGPK